MESKISGRKGGGGSAHQPTESPDSIRSVATAKILLALGEGEWAGNLDNTRVLFDGTPYGNSDGTINFPGARWEFRHGTQHQDYIQGIPNVENEITVNTELKSSAPWVRAISNTQLSAVRIRFGWPSLQQQKDNGDTVGHRIQYAIDVATDGGPYVETVSAAIDDKTTTLYERSHRVNLPTASTGWQIRVRRLTPNANSNRIADIMNIEAISEVIDAKLRYPNTALLYVEFDAKQFQNIPKISCIPDMAIIRVPDTYNPVNRTYSGTWRGGFKWAYSNNPAWVFYDILLSDRYGLGDRLDSLQISETELYRIAQYCDQMVPDGRGGSGTEPRFLCDVYIQSQEEAWTVLADLAAIFRGMTYWDGEQIVTICDMPEDVQYTFTRANVVNGQFSYSSSSERVRYTTAAVSWSDPSNHYADAVEMVSEQKLVRRYGINQTSLTAIGCTRQSEANRRGRWALLSNSSDNTVSFSVGLDGAIPKPGRLIAVADYRHANAAIGGRISAVNGRKITLDREPRAKPGDRLQINLPSGKTQARTVQAVSGRIITVTTTYSEVPENESAWAVDADDLALQLFRVVSVSDNNDNTFGISAVAHNPNKYPRIDTGARIEDRPTSVMPPGIQQVPKNITIGSNSTVEQGIAITTMRATWDAVNNAIAYEAEWRRDNNSWVSVPRTSTLGFEVPNIYAGRYMVRVRAVNASDIASAWQTSAETVLTGKRGNPPKPVGFITTSINWGIQLNWGFPANTGDTLKTEIQYTANADFSDAMLLSDVPYPSSEYIQMGLKAGQEFWYRAQLVDKTGNESGYTDWIRGMANDNADDYLRDIADDLLNSDDGERLTGNIETNIEAILQNALNLNSSVDHQMARYGENRADILTVKTTVADLDKSFAEQTTLVAAQFKGVGDQLDVNTAALEQKMTSVFDSSGGSAIYSMKAGVNLNGNYYDAGMTIAVLANSGQPVTTRIGFNANQFVLMSGSGGTQYSPFAVVNGQVFMSNAFIQNGTITSAKIADAAITNAKISGDIQSDGFSSNNGWQISKSRNTMTFNSASTGVFINATGFGYQENGVVLCKMGKKP